MAIRRSLGDRNCRFKSCLLHQKEKEVYMKQKKYIISENKLRQLLKDEIKLEALEYGGVDNWEWYGDSIQDYLKECNFEEIEDLIEKELQNYSLVEEYRPVKSEGFYIVSGIMEDGYNEEIYYDFDSALSRYKTLKNHIPQKDHLSLEYIEGISKKISI